MERAYSLNAYQTMVLAFNPNSTEEEITRFFHKVVVDANGHAACFGVYPRHRVISELKIPKVTKRTAFGTHW